MSRVQEIISQITKAGGLSRPNRYSVQIVPPNLSAALANNPQSLQQQQQAQQQASNTGLSLQSYGYVPDYFTLMGIAEGDMPNRLDFMCNKAELPGKTFDTTAVRTYGAYFDMPFIDVYSNIQLSFIVGRDMIERHFFDAWSYIIQDPETSDFNYVSDYATTMDIFQMDEYNQTNYGVRVFQCWPKTIGELRLEYEAFNSFHILPITFTYRKWVNLRINSGTPTSIESASGTPTGFEATIYPQGNS
jgi:hypothetical protein